ncbi:MAG: diguanylate cyclase [Candidatus Omnitrophica bacterium]|nr:diguanylate cyclase [Candidatus Omnitrophota bacterium]
MIIKDLILVDELTGHYNRRGFRESIGQILSLPHGAAKSFYLILTDLDHFKDINDTYGHLSGDFVLKEFAALLERGLQNTEAVIARYGGDEFVAILKNCNRQNVSVIWDKIRRDVANKEFILPGSKQSLRLTMSIGIVEFPQDGLTQEELLAKADEALYSSKRLGKNKLTFANEILVQTKEEKRIQKNIAEPPFVDRANELAEIQKFIFGGKSYKLIIINGEVGCGKSRMLQEVSIRAKARNLKTFFLVCGEQQKEKPYSLLEDIIGSLVYEHVEICQKAVFDLPPKLKTALSALPKLKRLFVPHLHVTHWDAEVRLNLFHGLADLCESIFTQINPLIIVDNLDWIDAASSEILSFIILSKKQTPFVLLGSTSRPASKTHDSDSALDALLSEISEFEIVPHIALPFFNQAETEEVVKGIFSGHDIPEKFTSEFFGATEGNPFFIVELIQYLWDRKNIYLQYPHWIFQIDTSRLPRDLRELLISKLQNLGAEEKELLLAVSGIGSNLKFDFLSKLKKINHGHLQDILSRISEKNILKLGENQVEDEVFFNNDSLRSVLYESIDTEKKKKIHLDIATTLEHEFKNNTEEISSELAFHFNKANLEAKTKNYAQQAVVYIENLFSNAEAEKVIENAINDREEKERHEPIKKDTWPLIMEIISSFNSAIKSMQMYQMPNEITTKMVYSLARCLEEFFTAYHILTFSCPSGDIKLLINGQELHLPSHSEDMFTKTILAIMNMANIGSITFHRTVSANEIKAFIGLLSNPKLSMEKKEQWKKILLDYKINAINIDEVLYKKVYSEEEKRQLHKEFIKEFMIKRAIGEAVPLPKEGGAKVGDEKEETKVIKKIKVFDEAETDLFAKTISHFSPDVLVEVITDEYRRHITAILDIREMVKVCLKDSQQKETIAVKLKDALIKLGMSDVCFAWLIDSHDFLHYPVIKRANTYLNADSGTILAMGVIENLKPTLNELFVINESALAEQILDKYLLNLQSSELEAKIYTAVTLPEIIKIIPAHLADFYVKRITALFLQALHVENDQQAYESLAMDAGAIISRLQELSNYWDIYRVISTLKEDLNASGGLVWRRQLAKEALKGIDIFSLCAQLASILDEVAFDASKNALVISLFKKMMPEGILYFIETLETRQSSTLLFEWYLQNLELLDILKEFKTETVPFIEMLIDSGAQKRVLLALDIMERINDEQQLPLYEKAIQSNDLEIKRNYFRSLIQMNTESAFSMIKRLFPRQDPETQRDIVIDMGVYGSRKEMSEFLKSLLDQKIYGLGRKEILLYIDKINTCLSHKGK